MTSFFDSDTLHHLEFIGGRNFYPEKSLKVLQDDGRNGVTRDLRSWSTGWWIGAWYAPQTLPSGYVKIAIENGHL